MVVHVTAFAWTAPGHEPLRATRAISARRFGAGRDRVGKVGTIVTAGDG